jgi:hypothetical protein
MNFGKDQFRLCLKPDHKRNESKTKLIIIKYKMAKETKKERVDCFCLFLNSIKEGDNTQTLQSQVLHISNKYSFVLVRLILKIKKTNKKR